VVFEVLNLKLKILMGKIKNKFFQIYNNIDKNDIIKSILGILFYIHIVFFVYDYIYNIESYKFINIILSYINLKYIILMVCFTLLGRMFDLNYGYEKKRYGKKE